MWLNYVFSSVFSQEEILESVVNSKEMFSAFLSKANFDGFFSRFLISRMFFKKCVEKMKLEKFLFS